MGPRGSEGDTPWWGQGFFLNLAVGAGGAVGAGEPPTINNVFVGGCV